MKAPASPGPAAERRLLERCLAGDETAWEELVRRLRAPARAAAERTIVKALGAVDPAEVEEAEQAAFSELVADSYAALRRFNWGCSLGTYVSVIAARAAVDLVKLRMREERTRGGAERLAELARTHAVAADPERSALDAELSESISGAIGQLPGGQALSARLYYFDGCSVGEIAEYRGVPYGTVTSDLRRAREALRHMLGKD